MVSECSTSGNAALVMVLTFSQLYLKSLFFMGDLAFLCRVIITCSPGMSNVQTETCWENAVYYLVSKAAFTAHPLPLILQCPRCSEKRRKERIGHLPHARRVGISYKKHKQM